jgi:hypothetical protein
VAVFYIGIIVLYCRKTLSHKTPPTMARGCTLRLGEGTLCFVMLKYLQPSRDVASTFPNTTSNQRLDDVVAFSDILSHQSKMLEDNLVGGLRVLFYFGCL